MTAEALPLHRVASLTTPRPPTHNEARLARLVERIKNDDIIAFDELYRLTRDDVARTLSHLIGRRADLEDLVQETYLKLLKAVPSFRAESQFRTFMYRVCANVALNHLRWWRRRREDALEASADGISTELGPERAAEAAQASRLVHRALASLAAKKRIVFVYDELCGLGPEEIGQIIGANTNTVRSRLHHARAEFTQSLRVITRAAAHDEVLR